jgi:hypothetical protein
MNELVTLLVPVEERYRAMVPDVARKYVELAGGSTSDAESIVDRLQAALAQLAAAAAGDAQITLACQVREGSVEIVAECGERSMTVTQALPARKLS